MGIPAPAEGRLFDERDDLIRGPWWLSTSHGAKALPGEDRSGKAREQTSAPLNAPWTMVIVWSPNMAHFGLEVDPRAEVYRPYQVNPAGAADFWWCATKSRPGEHTSGIERQGAGGASGDSA